MLLHNEIIEIGKIMSDLFKQMITLDTGMVVLTITIVEKVFTTERMFKSSFNRVLLALSLLFFIISILFSLIALMVIPNSLVDMLQHEGTKGAWVDNCSFYGSIIPFISGVIFFIFLATRSVFSNSTRTARCRVLKRNYRK